MIALIIKYKKHYITIAVCLFVICNSVQSLAQTEEKPNVILVVLDDLGWSDFGCYGSEIPTPNIDALAFEGIRCTRMYNGAVCIPSRAMLLTGAYNQQVGFQSINELNYFENAITLGELFKIADYETMAVGKHHSLENLFYRGFDQVYGLLDGAMNYFNPGLQRPNEPEPAQKKERVWVDNDLQFNTHDPEYQYYFPSDFYSTNVFTDKALTYLENIENSENPFFLYLAYNAPHDPLQAPENEIQNFEGNYDVGFDSIRLARYQKQLDLGIIDSIRYPLSNVDHPNWLSQTESWKNNHSKRMETYAAMIKIVDDGIGNLVSYLETIGERENTLIIITSDNGADHSNNVFGDDNVGTLSSYRSLWHWANISNTPFRKFKTDTYEGGINTPAIINWPNGIQNPGRIVDEVLHFVDIMPTLASILNVNVPKIYNQQIITPMQGVNFQSLLTSNTTIERNNPLFFQRFNSAVISEDWKLLKSGTEEWELYDMSTDRTELNNLANVNEFIKDSLIELHQNWAESVDQHFPVAYDDCYTVSLNEATNLNVLENDVDFDGTIDFEKTIIVEQAKNGIATLNLNTNEITYTNSSLASTDSFTYVIFDNNKAFSQITNVKLSITDMVNSIETACNFNNQVFPNPSSDITNVMVDPNYIIEDVKVTDIANKLVSSEIIETTDNNHFIIQSNKLTSGTYFVIFKTKLNGSFQLPFVIY